MSEVAVTPETQDQTGPKEGLDLPQLDEGTQSPEEEASDVTESWGKPGSSDLAAVYDVPVQVSAVLGHTTMQVNQLLKLGRGAVIELDRKVGEAVDIYINNRLVARGEVVVVDENLGISMTEIIKSDRV